jgi:hypothetical protein
VMSLRALDGTLLSNGGNQAADPEHKSFTTDLSWYPQPSITHTILSLATTDGAPHSTAVELSIVLPE